MAGLGCTDGYPTQDAPNIATMSAADHLDALGGYLPVVSGSGAARLVLDTPCTLRMATAAVRGKAPAGGWSVSLAQPKVRFDVQAGTGRYMVSVHSHGQGEAGPHGGRFDAGRWTDAVAVRSHLQQLQMRCLASLGQAGT